MAHNYYAVLGVSENASKDEIKKAYRFLAQQLHPDKHQGENAQIAEKKLKELNEAYETLSDDCGRAAYDRPGGNAGNESGGFKKSGDPSRDDFLIRIETYVKLKQWKTAITQSSKYLIKYPGDIQGYFFRGEAYCGKGDSMPRFAHHDDYTRQLAADTLECYNHARDDYDRILTLDPDNAEAFAWRGFIRERCSDVDIGVTKEMDRVLVDSTGETFADGRLGLLYEAISDLREAVRLDPHNADYLAHLRRLEEKYHQVSNAVKAENIVNNTIGITGTIIKYFPTILVVAGILWLIGKCGL